MMGGEIGILDELTSVLTMSCVNIIVCGPDFCHILVAGIHHDIVL